MGNTNSNDSNHDDEDGGGKYKGGKSRNKKSTKKLNKTPTVKKARLMPNTDNVKRRKKNRELEELWTENKIFCLPLIPNEKDEREVFMESEFRCHYCDDLGDSESLQCKVCPRLSHIRCLYRRGHLASQSVPVKIEWTCSDCSDLSRILSDEEVRQIINIFEELDFRKACYVKLADYLKIKKRMRQEKGEKMSEEEVKNEERRFRLIDLDDSGTITWNEFVDFETADMLSKKNKVELSNHLTLKELITAKKLFLSYDKEKLFMIKREDAKACYLAYIDKLNEKLGAPFLEHIGNCAELFGFVPEGEEAKTTAKTMWDEFIRKMTILILYDRLNSHHFMPRYWKPGVWYSSKTAPSTPAVLTPSKTDAIASQPVTSTHETSTAKVVNVPVTSQIIVKTEIMPKQTAEKPASSVRTRPAVKPSSVAPPKAASKVSLVKKNILKMNSELAENANKKIVYSSLLTDGFDLNQLMSREMELNKFHPHSQAEFGSYRYVIRSKTIQSGQKLLSEPKSVDRITSALVDIEKENTTFASQSLSFQLAGVNLNRPAKASDLDAKAHVKLAKPIDKKLVSISPRVDQLSEEPASKSDSSKYYASETFNSSSIIGSFFSTIEKNKNDLISIQISDNLQLLKGAARRVDQKLIANETNAIQRSNAVSQRPQNNCLTNRPAYNFNKVSDDIREYFNIRNKPLQLVAPNTFKHYHQLVKMTSDESSFIFPEVSESKSITSKTISSSTANRLMELSKSNEKILLRPGKSLLPTNLPKITKYAKNDHIGLYA